MDLSASAPPDSAVTDKALRRHLPRAALGGMLMGLANLVPGISGGTMLLAAGVYTDFIESVARVTRLRFDRRPLLMLLVIVGAAAIGIVLFAGPVKNLVVHQRWMMYSVFVGLTLGGIPALWRISRPPSRALWTGAAAGFVVMAVVAAAQQAGAGAAGAGGGFVGLTIAGLAGAASMILPGISGGYLLLILGQYVTILSAIESSVDAARARDFGALIEPLLGVFVPVAIGMVIGVAVVSNLLRYLLRAHRQATLGVLLGLLAGVVVGLWPFQHPVAPQPGSVIKGQVVTADTVDAIDLEDWPLEFFDPSAGQVMGALGLVALGAVTTLLVARVGRDD